MKYRIQTYILWGPGIYYSYILLVYPIRPWNLLNVKKASNLIKVISSYNICYGIKSQQAKKTFVIQYQKQDFFVPFHQVIFDHSISCVLLIDKWKLQKLKDIWKKYLIQQKKAFKKKIKYYTNKDKYPNFTNFFMPKINNSNLSNEKQKELKMKLWQLEEKISKASLPVSADLSNDFKSIIFETDQRKISPFMRLFWEQQQKYV